MEGLVTGGATPGFWAGKRVFVTGHTGFKGGWLSLWLQAMGVQVYGYSQEPPTEPSLFHVADVQRGLAASTIGDVRDYARLSDVLVVAKPDVVFHLAAQSLVRHSYQHPVDTYATNVMGVVHLLEAVRGLTSVRAVVNITSDKCYENLDESRSYREADPMGGHDPYSSSKGCAELVTSAYRRAFLADRRIAVATARAGNVIGGGDWAADRLVPDVLRAVDAGMPVVVRAPKSTRPWQHVLEPVSGYLLLAERLYTEGEVLAGAWNFGPADESVRPVQWILEQLRARCPQVSWQRDDGAQPHEAAVLALDSTKARTQLGWRPRWPLESALDKTLAWHQAWRRGEDMRAVTLAQIQEYVLDGAAAPIGTL